ncbi:hypothetical protein SDC9_95279 [bioreactor metagenome]|uniref:Uncharacterized protein n=1 Tax=bioreactor metagenome TaxID=1076179 RepID=A0A645AFW9_9ZZZZ
MQNRLLECELLFFGLFGVEGCNKTGGKFLPFLCIHRPGEYKSVSPGVCHHLVVQVHYLLRREGGGKFFVKGALHGIGRVFEVSHGILENIGLGCAGIQASHDPLFLSVNIGLCNCNPTEVVIQQGEEFLGLFGIECSRKFTCPVSQRRLHGDLIGCTPPVDFVTVHAVDGEGGKKVL